MGCETAREHIEHVALSDWTGLPQGCTPAGMFGDLGDPSEWAVRPLGEDFQRAAFRVLELGGYYRPTLSARDGRVILFDGMNPELTGDYTELIEDLGDPDERLDYSHGTLPVSGGEWIFAARGMTLFVNTTADTLLHVALYTPTTASDYRARLRPHFGKTLWPRPLSN
jgi:hypothetical protein